MFNNNIMDYADKEGGLYAKNRFHDIVRVGMDPECLAF